MTEEKEPAKSREMLVVILMGSESDKPKADEIGAFLEDFGVPYAKRVGSAHKTPLYTKGIIEESNCIENTDVVFIAVAGKQNALGPFTDAQTTKPVISLAEDDRAGDLLDLPSGIATLPTIRSETAGLMAVKILALNRPELASKILSFQKQNQNKFMEADKRMHPQN